VSTGVGCGSDLVVQDRTGWIFPVGDVPAFVNRIESAADAVRTRRAELREAVAQRIGAYSLEVAVDGTLKAITGSRRNRMAHPAESMAVR
jgi:glycosyltransferase involved in cell wall biosynthesis